jgi:hypothetical protein
MSEAGFSLKKGVERKTHISNRLAYAATTCTQGNLLVLYQNKRIGLIRTLKSLSLHPLLID